MHIRRVLTSMFLCVCALAQAQLDAPVSYSSSDSMVMLGDGTAFLHGKGVINYKTMELDAEFIRMKSDSSTIYAVGVYDTLREEWVGKPVFKDGKDSYESGEITYNIKTQKGFIRNVVTEQGEGYIIAEKTKKVEGDEMMMAGGKYTTCDDHEHPHFYLRMTKAKVKPGDYIATGPAYLVVGDVPLPLAVPFGFFPFSKTYSSGLIMPTFGDEYERGLFLKGLGYYWAINDYMDLEVTGDIYTKGTWAVYAKSRYIKRYKFSGNINIEYRSDVRGEKELPTYSKSNSFRIAWTHTQDSKANPYSTFSANVNFSTSGYNQNSINNYYRPEINSANTTQSSVNYTQRFPDSPWTIGLNASITQRTSDSTLSVTAPSLTVNMSSIYPFKRKNPVGKERWYERIKMSYSGAFSNSITCKESYFFHSNFVKDWQNKITHSIPIDANFVLFKYLTVSPRISLRDKMYFQRVDQSWDMMNNELVRDTTQGFFNVFDFDVSMSMSTKLYGFYTPYRKWFGDKIDRFRHVMTPSISFSYHPDFSTPWWQYYDSYQQPVGTTVTDSLGNKMFVPVYDAAGMPMMETKKYSRFTQGNAPQGASGTLSFSLDNNLEVKVRDDKDTTGQKPYKVISLIDNFGISGGYNFIADSMNWSKFTVSLRIKIPKVNYTINLQTQLDPYMYELDAAGRPVHTNKQYWHNGRFPHWNGVGTSINYTFNNQTFKKLAERINKDKEKKSGTPEAGSSSADGEADHDHDHGDAASDRSPRTRPKAPTFSPTDIQWSLNLSYTIRYGEVGSFDYEKMYPKMGLIQNLSMSGTLNFGKGWKVSATTSFDFKAKKFSYTNFNVTRDLHCWTMSASFVPFGPYKTYSFHIGVNASMLADLKYDKTSAESMNKKVNWW
ncbi:MAG: LPS-assembly protein LptD [Paludibacteraceae bacterium]|nr:LPS-assembly protein LptD [Paludibacteraceae bacterium]